MGPKILLAKREKKWNKIKKGGKKEVPMYDEEGIYRSQEANLYRESNIFMQLKKIIL